MAIFEGARDMDEAPPPPWWSAARLIATLAGALWLAIFIAIWQVG
jgi:hypothetical protein